MEGSKDHHHHHHHHHHSISPQTEYSQSQYQHQQQGLGFQSSSPPSSSPAPDPNPDPNLDPHPLTDDKLRKILSDELLSLALKDGVNEQVQGLVWKQATDKEEEEELALKQAEEFHYLAVKQAFSEALQSQGLNQVIDEVIALKQEQAIDEVIQSLALRKTKAQGRGTDREEDVERETENEPQSAALEENEANEKGEENENEDWNVGDQVKDEEGIDNDNDNRSENENEEGNNLGGYSGAAAVSKDGKFRQYHYPLRPDAEDCSYYMRTGTCKFGLNCKFNHPPRRKNQATKDRVKQKEEIPERPAQTECKYYLTSGGCKYGKACRYNHSKGKSSVVPILEFNFLGLPIRQGEKECPYYMRNGSCKYGSNCRFNHPDPTAVGVGDPSSTYGNGGSVTLQGASQSNMSPWSSPRTLNETTPFVPVMFPPTQGVPSPNPEWNGYQAPVYPTSERSLPTPPAFSLNNPATDSTFYTHHQQQILVDDFPERHGQPECSYFLKTGDCKYKSHCKFHHPKNRIPKTAPCLLSDKGLPLRPDQNICTHYSRYGICKFGPACKFDHPVNFANSTSSVGSGPDQPPSFGNSAATDGTRMGGSANGSEFLIQQPV